MEQKMNEIVFLVEEAPEGGYTARALYPELSIFTEGDSVETIKQNIMESLHCHFDEDEKAPQIIRLHFVKDEIIYYAPAS
jgi:hypothetical protein